MPQLFPETYDIAIQLYTVAFLLIFVPIPISLKVHQRGKTNLEVGKIGKENYYFKRNFKSPQKITLKIKLRAKHFPSKRWKEKRKNLEN